MGKKSDFSIHNKGQSFVELAIVLPLLLFLLIGFVEVGAIVYSYLSMLDVAREAARFASEHDPTVLEGPGALGYCEDEFLHYFHDSACIVVGSGFNPDLVLDPTRDDVTISVFTIDDNNVTDRLPGAPYINGVWSLYGNNWTRNCDGTFNSNTPFFEDTEVEAIFNLPPPTVGPGTPAPSGGAPVDKGRVLVEVYYCHDQLLNLPLLSDLIPNPVPLHAYAFMPAPAAAPTPTPIP
jgi:hypothetical protein